MACSKGEKSLLTGEYCPYVEHTPQTQEGFEILDILERYCHFKFAPSGSIAGFDTSQILQTAKILRYEQQAILRLLSYADQGLQDALATITRDKDNQ